MKPNKFEPKTGDKVLANVGADWEEKRFLFKYKKFYICCDDEDFREMNNEGLFCAESHLYIKELPSCE